ncbi:cell division protein FtsZ [Lutibacter oricola]|uniref:Cell division protein FtsZ n=1 Tax=Lutibacter oricola TaxID=762486 RepID=A0A1H3E981_9FLAO|nr:cell division protein FtsZ [Lutibacter oricola]SDX75215.1 cell division protein FtsZ [Lutibacter oricola]
MSEFNNISFDLPKNQSNVIKVIGVGGGGSNAVNHMYTQGINGVDFVVCNTDAQALQSSPIPTKIQLGVSLTEGLGAGANPEVGEQAAEESIEHIKDMLASNSKMVFITVGMGGGTGTGAAPVIARIARELDLLTIGIVTIPFSFEGKMRNDQAQKGIEKLREYVDSLVVINNNKLREVYGNLGFKAGFSKADEVLSTAARGIAEVITHHYTQNIDLKDAKTVLSNSGTAIMGSATASGVNRSEDAISKALDSPLLNDNKITGAKNVLLLIVSGVEEITIDEIGEINDFIQSEAKSNVNIIMGVGEDEALGDSIAVTIVATGFNKDQQHEISNTEAKKIIHTLGDEQEAKYDFTENKIVENTETETIIPSVEDAIEQEVEVVAEEKIVFDLGEIEEEEINMIPTTEFIKNLDVVYEEISLDKIEEKDFVITPVTPEKEEVIEKVIAEVKEEKPEEQQITFTFDMPLSEVEELKKDVVEEVKTPKEIVNKVQDVIDEPTLKTINQIEVVDHKVVEPVEEIKKVEEQVYFTLEDYNVVEENLVNAKKVEPVSIEEEIVDDLNITVRSEAKEDVSINDTEVVGHKEVSPLDLTISELQAKAMERREKFKNFNYKFHNKVNRNIDEIEKEPAYKRMGVELDETTHSSDTTQSRTTLDVDDNDDIQLRSNNSYLHDNVD